MNGSDEDVDLMRTRLDARVARLKAEKKAKADKKAKAKAESTATSTATSTEAATNPDAEQPGPSSKPSTSGKPGGSSSLKPIIPNKRALISDKIGDDPMFKKSKQDYSVAKDPNATDVYKSLFTTHESEKDQQRAHWVTYNPFYN